jgi:hypothetical protein
MIVVQYKSFHYSHVVDQYVMVYRCELIVESNRGFQSEISITSIGSLAIRGGALFTGAGATFLVGQLSGGCIVAGALRLDGATFGGGRGSSSEISIYLISFSFAFDFPIAAAFALKHVSSSSFSSPSESDSLPKGKNSKGNFFGICLGLVCATFFRGDFF